MYYVSYRLAAYNRWRVFTLSWRWRQCIVLYSHIGIGIIAQLHYGCDTFEYNDKSRKKQFWGGSESAIIFKDICCYIICVLIFLLMAVNN